MKILTILLNFFQKKEFQSHKREFATKLLAKNKSLDKNDPNYFTKSGDLIRWGTMILCCQNRKELDQYLIKNLINV